MNVGIETKSIELANKALDSHDGIAAKRTRILLSYSENEEIEMQDIARSEWPQ